MADERAAAEHMRVEQASDFNAIVFETASAKNMSVKFSIVKFEATNARLQQGTAEERPLAVPPLNLPQIAAADPSPAPSARTVGSEVICF